MGQIGACQLPIVFRMLPKCPSMWVIRPLVMTCSTVIGGASVRRPALRQLIVMQATDHRGGRCRTLLEERDCLRPGAVGVFLRVPGVHLV